MSMIYDGVIDTPIKKIDKRPKAKSNYPKWAVEGDITGWYQVLGFFTSRAEARAYRKEIVSDGYARKAHVRRVEVSIIQPRPIA